MLFKRFAVIATLGAGLLVAPVLAQDAVPATIADAVVASASAETPEFSILLAAVQAADPSILELLSNPEASMTVFAPTDAAFAAALEALGVTAEDLLGNTELLNSVLTYHVTTLGALDAATVVSAYTASVETLGQSKVSVPTANGQYLDVMVTEEGGVMVDNANVVVADVMAGNGVIHVIDAVLLPESRTLGEIVAESAGAETPEFSVLLAAADAAGLVPALSDPEAEAITVFAPTDAAFVAALEALGVSAEELLADTETLTAVLTYHVAPGIVGTNDLATAAGGGFEGAEEVPAWYAGLGENGEVLINTLNGATLAFAFSEEGKPMINASMVVAADIDASNGIIHVIDAVLLPE